MSETTSGGYDKLDPTQALELVRLVDLEARWENLRQAPSQAAGRLSTEELHAKQKAYEAFHTRLAEYNRRHSPRHQPELLLNTPARLGKWCRAMRDLCVRTQHDPRVPSLAHLVEKGYRWAERVALRTGEPCPPRPALPGNIGEAIRHLEDLGKWCEGLPGGAPALPSPQDADRASPSSAAG